jgi:hypothetical protein
MTASPPTASTEKQFLSGGTGQLAKAASSTTATDIPGFSRPKPKAAASRLKTSMFMPSKKPGAAKPLARAEGIVKYQPPIYNYKQ